MRIGRSLLNGMTAGALVVGLAISLIYPQVKTWSSTITVGTNVCTTEKVVSEVTWGMFYAQMYGIATGAVLGMIIALVLVVRSRRTAKPPA